MSILFSKQQWLSLTKWGREEIEKKCPEVKDAKPCYLEEDHQNQTGYMICANCNPDEFMEWTK